MNKAKGISLLLVLALLVSCVSLVGCGEKKPKAEATPGPTAAATPMPKPETTPTPEPVSAVTPAPKQEATPMPAPTPTPEVTPTSEPDMSAMWLSLDDLKSYRSHIRTEMPNFMGEGPDVIVMIVDMEVVNEPPPKAEHTTMSMDMGEGMSMDVESITIGDKSWVKMAMLGDNWIESTIDEQQQQQQMPDMPDMEDILDMASDMALVGEETVNGVHCKHYTMDTEFSITTEVAGGQSLDVSGHVEGDMWIADQSGLPQVTIRERSVTQMDSAILMPGQQGSVTVKTERDVTNVNESFQISPPPADQISDMPQIPGMTGGIPGMPGGQ